MHRCHRTRSSTNDRVNDYHSQGANCKRRPHILNTHLDQISTPAPAPSVLPIHPRHTCTTAASMASRLCGYSIQAKHHTPCPLSAPDRRCYCSAWLLSQHLCPRRRILRIAISRKPMSTPPGRRATRQASREDRPHGGPRRHPARRPARRQRTRRTPPSPMLIIPRGGITTRRTSKQRAIAMQSAKGTGSVRLRAAHCTPF